MFQSFKFKPSFKWQDFVVLGCCLLVSAGIGLFFGYQQRKTSLKEYMLGQISHSLSSLIDPVTPFKIFFIQVPLGFRKAGCGMVAHERLTEPRVKMTVTETKQSPRSPCFSRS